MAKTGMKNPTNRHKMNKMKSFNRPMKNTTAIALIVVAATALAGCDSARQALTQTKAAPDEFSVYTRAPLTLPPDYGLRPPSDGKSEEAGATTTRDEARRVLLGNNQQQIQPVEAATPGTSVLLAKAGAGRIEPGIRETVNRETSAYATEDLKFMEKLLYGDKAATRGEVVDPTAEAKRIQEKQALGQPINDGTTPMIEDNPASGGIGSVIGGWFN